MAYLAVSTLQYEQFWMGSFPIWYKWSLPWEGGSHTITFDLDLYLQGCLTVSLPISWFIFICGTNTTHVSHKISKSIGQRSRSHRSFEFLQSIWGYPSRSLIYNFASLVKSSQSVKCISKCLLQHISHFPRPQCVKEMHLGKVTNILGQWWMS